MCSEECLCPLSFEILFYAEENVNGRIIPKNTALGLLAETNYQLRLNPNLFPNCLLEKHTNKQQTKSNTHLKYTFFK